MNEWLTPFAMVGSVAGSAVVFFFALHVVMFATKGVLKKFLNWY